MINVELTQTEYNFIQFLINDAGELVPDDYYKDMEQEYRAGDTYVYDGTFYGVPIDEPVNENHDTNRDLLYAVLGELKVKFQ